MAKRSISTADNRKPRPRNEGRVEKSELLKRIDPDDDNEEDLEILEEAYERFDEASAYESDFRNKYVQDVKFANADSDNGWQWPDDMRQDRMLNRRPALTINKTQNHVKLVVNDGRMNRVSVTVSPTGKESSFKAAEGLESLVRNIEYRSSANAIYDSVRESAVEGGIGYFRVISIYPDERSFNQELRIAPVQNQMNVFLDPNIKHVNGMDAQFGFIFEDQPKRQFERETGYKAPLGEGPFDNGLGTDWISEHSVRVAEYYRIESTKEELIYYKDAKGREALFLRSEIPRGMRAAFRRDEKAFKEGTLDPEIQIMVRPTEIKRLEWYKIAAHKIIDRRQYKTKYIPIIRVVGREKVIEGKLDRKGIVRPMKDAQRMYNYNASAEAEASALATKTHWMAPLEAISGNETAWNRANIDNKAVLTYRHKDRDGDPIPPPQRIDPAKSAEAYLHGMEIASRELEMTSGQGPAQFGRPTQERTGIAITKTQRTGELITYDFLDNETMAIEYLGMVLLDWIPHCYDVKQVIQIMDKDGTERNITLDPNAEQPYAESKEGETVNIIMNPKIGQYKVRAAAGPSFATQRQESFNAMVQVVTGQPEVLNDIGDLMFYNADFPGADEIAERLRRKIKHLAPWLLDDNAKSPQVMQLEQQIAAATAQIQELMQLIAEKDRKLSDKEDDLEIKAAKVSNDYRQTDISRYDARTKRLTAAANTQLDLSRVGQEGAFRKLIIEVMQEVLEGDRDQNPRMPIEGIVEDYDGSGGDQQQAAAPQEDTEDFLEPRQAPDGHHYIRQGGQHYRVDTGALLDGQQS